MNHPLALVYALSEEVKPILQESRILARILQKSTLLMEAEFRDEPVVFCRTGVGMGCAHEGTERLLDHFQPSSILSVGFAGGTDPALQTGDLIVATEIRSETPTDHFATNAAGRELLETLIREEQLNYRTGPLMTLWKMARRGDKETAGRNGILAVDMETAAIAAVAAKKRLPFLSLRAIFDPVDEELPFTEPYTNETNPIGFILKNPRALLKIPKYFRMNQICQKNLAKILTRVIDSQGLASRQT
jgi:adenosylhomocysteine nucleosidase